MKNSSAIPNDGVPERPWIVDFAEFRTRTEAQRRVIDELQETAIEVLMVWLQEVTPGAVVIESKDQSLRRIAFRRRSEMRRFMRTFGGRQVRSAKNGRVNSTATISSNPAN